VGAAAFVWVAALRLTGCGDACEEAVDYCLECDLEKSTCEQRFDQTSDADCQAAVDQYQRGGCSPYDNGSCEGDPEPQPYPQ